MRAFGPNLSLAEWDDAELLFWQRREAVIAVDQPLVLISQLQRSGGTLLSSLLDGHPELLCHPYELQIGSPTKHDWPTIRLEEDVSAWWEQLSEPRLRRLFADGYRKTGTNPHAIAAGPLPFTIVPSFVERLFRVLCNEDAPATQREMFCRYFTAYFNAWLDCQGLRDHPKSWVVGFGPRLGWGDSRRRFFADYPDGRLIAILRDPRAWFTSARAIKPYREIHAAVGLWCRAAREIADAKRESPGEVLAISYEMIVAHPRSTMRVVADWLQIGWDERLLVPTFNRQPILANSSDAVEHYGIRPERADAWRRALEPGAIEHIERVAMPLYEETRASALDVR